MNCVHFTNSSTESHKFTYNILSILLKQPFHFTNVLLYSSFSRFAYSFPVTTYYLTNRQANISRFSGGRNNLPQTNKEHLVMWRPRRVTSRLALSAEIV